MIASRRSFLRLTIAAALTPVAARLAAALPAAVEHHLPEFWPRGVLPCDGRAVSRAAYRALFAAIGTTYGAGDDGATTFNVPDLRGRAVGPAAERPSWDEARHPSLSVAYGIVAIDGVRGPGYPPGAIVGLARRSS